MVPLSFERLVTLALLPFALLPLLWGWFALKRAQKTDPLRPRREAHARLRSILSRLRSETNPQLSPRGSQLLISWQHDSAIIWGIPHAAPAPVALPEPTWAALWAEADQALYCSNRALSADWIAQAEAALAAKRVKSFSPLRLFLPQNLLPFVALVALTFNIASIALAQEAKAPNSSSAITAYRSGDFETAEKAWRDGLEKNPTDATARYNLSLAVAQQDRWPESVAQAMAAFVQNPSNAPARWQLALASDKAGFLPEPVVRFLPAGPRESLAAIAAPGIWQIVLLVASCIFVTALAILLYGMYRKPSRLRTWSVVTLLGLSLILAGSSMVSLHAYGISADSRAVIAWRPGLLRSIPTEADITQKTTALPAGSVALKDGSFALGWVRNDDIIALWR